MQYELMTDEQLVQVCIEDKDKYEYLVHRHQSALISFLLKKHINNRANAEDIAQEAFIKAYLNLAKFDQHRKWKTWLYQIAINAHKSSLRKQHNDFWMAINPAIIVSKQDLQKNFENSIDMQKIKRAMAGLEPNQRDLLIMCFEQQMSLVQIRAQLKIPIHILRISIDRAKRNLIAAFHSKN